MPTKKKRVGFIPREDVMKIIDKLSLENNLSNSKIISILVEEALSTRGIIDKNSKETQLYQLPNYHSQNLSYNSADFDDNAKPPIDSKLGNDVNPSKSNSLNEAKEDAFDFQTYKKFLSFIKFQEMMEKYKT